MYYTPIVDPCGVTNLRAERDVRLGDEKTLVNEWYVIVMAEKSLLPHTHMYTNIQCVANCKTLLIPLVELLLA